MNKTNEITDLETWNKAEEDVTTALMSAEEMLEYNNYMDLRSTTNGADRAKIIVDVAGLILAQMRYYKDMP